MTIWHRDDESKRTARSAWRTLLRIAVCGCAMSLGAISQPAVAEDFAFGRAMSDISLDIAPPQGTGPDGRPYPLPPDQATAFFAAQPGDEYRLFSATAMRHHGNWNFCYQPLLFEEVNAERYGDVHPGVQPAISSAKFYARTLMLPYSVLRTQARQPDYFSHVDRPGYGGIRE